MEIQRRIHFQRLSAGNVLEICKLSETLTPIQREMVADNAVSIAQAYCSDNAWLRAIYLEQAPVGFIMLHFGSDYEDGIDCSGAFLWRLMIAGPHQGLGYGKEALAFLIEHLRAQGYRQLFTSSGQGPGSPEAFYRRLGFEPTGDGYGDQMELVYHFPGPV